MKTNEIIINEGPLDFAKNVAAGFKGLGQGGLAGAKAAYGAQDAANKQADKTGTIVKKAIDQWNATAAQMAQGGQQATPEQATAWLTKFLGKAPAGKPAGANPAQISQFITQEIQKYVADRAAQGLGQTAAPAAEPAPAQAATQQPAQAQAQPVQAPTQTWKYKVPGSDSVYNVGTNQAGQLVIDMDNNGDWETVDDADDKKAIMDPANKVDANAQPGQAASQAQQPAAAAPAAPAKPGANEFAQKLQADFEAFVNAGGSTGAPAVKQALKSLWMQAGGTKAESKKNTKKPV
jgi:hypothetical protein